MDLPLDFKVGAFMYVKRTDSYRPYCALTWPKADRCEGRGCGQGAEMSPYLPSPMQRVDESVTVVVFNVTSVLNVSMLMLETLQYYPLPGLCHVLSLLHSSHQNCFY